MFIYKKDLKPYYNIIDIRDEEEYKKGHIYNAINIPVDKLLNNVGFYLNKNEKYYIYCARGYTSKKCSLILNTLGYNIVNVVDGYEK